MDNTKNTIGAIFLGIIILAFIIGGFFAMKYLTNPKNIKKEEKTNEELKTELRINTSKDYIYFDNTKEIIGEIYKEDVVLNFKGLEQINETLHNEVENLSNNIVKTDNQEIPEGVTCENDLYSFSYRDYENTQYQKYSSVVIRDYDYNCINGSLPRNLKSFVIDNTSGKIITNEELLSTFNITEDSIIEQVKKRLEDTQILDEDIQVIDIEGTINDFNNTTYNNLKALSISKNGKLKINFIVKSNKINYNDSIELN